LKLNFSKRLRQLSTLAFFTMSLLLAACSQGTDQPNASSDDNQGENPPHSSSPVITSMDLEPYDQIQIQLPAYETVVTEFNLGDRIYTSPYDLQMPYALKGLIGVPKGEGPFPVILMSHGSHSNDDERKRFDTGFEYLVEALASKGFVAISLDLSKPYIWKYGDNDDREKSIHVALDHFDQLLKVVSGEAAGYPVDLIGKIDLTKIGLLGHSRGGETVLDIASELEHRGYPASAVLSVAPTFFFPDRSWPSADVAILVPEYDGDVVNLDGYLMLKALDKNTAGHHALVLLRRANHNFFNPNIERNDALMMASEFPIENQLTREEQEAFLVRMSSEFFFDSLMNSDPGQIFDFQHAQPNQMYGLDVKVMTSTPDKIHLVDLENPEMTTTSDGASAVPVTDAWYFKNDEILIDTITGGDGPYSKRRLLEVQWTQPSAKVVLKPLMTDFSNHDALALTLVPDSASSLQQGQAHQSFSVKLTDSSGNATSLSLPDTLNALALTPGEIGKTDLGDLVLSYWSARTPLSTVWIPLEAFKNVDLEQIDSLEILFDNSDTGALYIESVELY
jgi:dienelactone hydrolase